MTTIDLPGSPAARQAAHCAIQSGSTTRTSKRRGHQRQKVAPDHYAGKNEYLNRGDRGNRIQKQIENDRLFADECQALFSTALTEAQAWLRSVLRFRLNPAGRPLVGLSTSRW